MQFTFFTLLSITSNDRTFGCPITYMNTIHITSNDHSFGCLIIHLDTILITSNDYSFGCLIIYMDTIHIISNDHSFGCPITYVDIIHNAILFRNSQQCFIQQCSFVNGGAMFDDNCQEGEIDVFGMSYFSNFFLKRRLHSWYIARVEKIPD